MFAALFAAYAVLSGETNGGPAARDLFDLNSAAIETLCLLVSSYTCGLAALGLETRKTILFYAGAGYTFLLGAIFVGFEYHEFAGLIAQDAGPSRSAFLSAFFNLVGLHGLHVSLGLIWLLDTVLQVAIKGCKDAMLRRFQCFSMFWHALDIVWVALLTLVYLMGTR